VVTALVVFVFWSVSGRIQKNYQMLREETILFTTGRTYRVKTVE
jgi:hypothetical protein